MCLLFHESVADLVGTMQSLGRGYVEQRATPKHEQSVLIGRVTCMEIINLFWMPENPRNYDALSCSSFELS
jgi:hypothetical protein